MSINALGRISELVAAKSDDYVNGISNLSCKVCS